MGTLRLVSGNSFLGGKLEPNGTLEVDLPEQHDLEVTLDEDDLIWPGFIDFHLHLGDRGRDGFGVEPPDLCRAGVFAAGDAGTFGWKNLPPARGGFPYRRWLSLLPYGLLSPSGDRYPGLDSEPRLIEAYETNRDQLAGVKIRLGQHDLDEDELLLADGTRIARRLGAPLMVHITGTWIPLGDLVAALQPRDVITHLYHGRRGSILTDAGIDPAIEVARSKGVHLDLAHGRNHFSWRVFDSACHRGIAMDTVSTDLTRSNRGRPPLIDLAHLCSKLLSAGFGWPELYRATVEVPGRYLRLAIPEGSLVVLRKREAPTTHYDCEGEFRSATHRWSPTLAVYANRLVTTGLQKGIR